MTQVGYHNRFVGAFQEVKRLLDAGAIGPVNTALAEAYGPVVLKPAGRTWRSQRSTGGGCLYDYAAHPLNLLTWYLGAPQSVSGSQLTSIFSAQIDDSVASTLHYPNGHRADRLNWSDESQRKMTTKITLWGPHGRIYADRQEIQVYLRDTATVPEGYRSGWNVRYTTELTEAPFFLRSWRGVQRPGRRIRTSRDRRCQRGRQRLQLGCTDRPGDLDDKPGRRADGFPPANPDGRRAAGRADQTAVTTPTRRRKNVTPDQTRAAGTTRGKLRWLKPVLA